MFILGPKDSIIESVILNGSDGFSKCSVSLKSEVFKGSTIIVNRVDSRIEDAAAVSVQPISDGIVDVTIFDEPIYRFAIVKIPNFYSYEIKDVSIRRKTIKQRYTISKLIELFKVSNLYDNASLDIMESIGWNYWNCSFAELITATYFIEKRLCDIISYNFISHLTRYFATFEFHKNNSNSRKIVINICDVDTSLVVYRIESEFKDLLNTNLLYSRVCGFEKKNRLISGTWGDICKYVMDKKIKNV